ncbi:MAG TPA: DUF6428 family protein [Cytophagaceae bacterium]|jgi:hypothetical protein
MKVSEIKEYLTELESVNFRLQSGGLVPEHFHVTEVGVVSKHFIDCRGTERMEKVANLQLWDANDYDHRLQPQKLLKIINLSEKVLGMEDLEIEVEYQSDTIGKYGLTFNGNEFILNAKKTNCLASDKCGAGPEKVNKTTSNPSQSGSCSPGGGCC